MHKIKKCKERGFTLIELVIAILIIGILSAIAIPKFIDLSDDALDASKKGMSGAIKSSHVIALADLKRYPTVSELATYVSAEGVAIPISGDGVEVVIDSARYTVPTFADSGCTQRNGIVNGSEVRCVGTIP